jgi:hypothetical protein
VAHDAPLGFEPHLVRHEKGSNRLFAVARDGAKIQIGDGIAPELAARVAKARSLLLVRMEGDEPVEGFELPLIHA